MLSVDFCQTNRDGGRDSSYPTRLQIKESVQHNIEIVYFKCKIPLWVGDGLHAFSSELVRLMLGKQV
jgi:hypothetical protein